MDTHSKGAKHAFFKAPTKEQCKDAGLALVLIALIASMLSDASWITPAAIVCTLLLMTAPKVFHYFAILWFGLSEALGTVMSKVILTIVFFTVVTPIALVRRILGKDAMQMKDFKKSSGSVFRKRDSMITAEDLEQMF